VIFFCKNGCVVLAAAARNEPVERETMSAQDSNVVFLPVDDTGHRVIAAVWEALRAEAELAAERDAAMSRMMNTAVIRHQSFGHALAHRLAMSLGDQNIGRDELQTLFHRVYNTFPAALDAAAADLQAIRDRDPSVANLLTPFLYFKGFLALQGYRIAHWLWERGEQHFALHIQSEMSSRFAVDIHPAAVMGRGIMLDHATGIVIGETAVVEDDVSILQEVTLGGTGSECGDRHPKVRRGVLIGAGAKILGNIEIGVGAKVGAGSVVLDPVAPYTSVVGVPARPVGKPHAAPAGLTMDQMLTEPDYVI
jgi:serine O-acetyltransferase